MNRRTDGAAAAAVVLLAVVAFLLMRAPVVANWLATPQASSPAAELVRRQRAPLRVLSARDGYDPIVTYDPADKRLTVTEHTAADVLLCIAYGQGDEPVCKLPAQWLGR